MLNKNARNNKMAIILLYILGRNQGLYIGGGRMKVVVCKTGSVGEGVVLHV